MTERSRRPSAPRLAERPTHRGLLRGAALVVALALVAGDAAACTTVCFTDPSVV
jgi:hypothetical protein